MEPIHVDPSLRSKEVQGQGTSVEGVGVGAGLKASATMSASGLLMHMGVGGSSRKEYSLAPCHHLFVSCDILIRRRVYIYAELMISFSIRNVWKR
jgi:hypothetical protein